MSHGPGRIQNYLMDLLLAHSPDPMTFAEILAIACPPGSFASDLAKILGGSRVGQIRSLRRALRRLCDTGDALPRQARRVVEEGRALIKEAKGLGR